MTILAIETSAKAASCAVIREGAPVALAFQATALTHSRTLMPMVEDMLRNSELSLRDMDAVAVAAGPGSFTGLRIGVAAVKGLAWAAELPCVGVSTLEAMAAPLAHAGGRIIGAMDARRQQIYNAVFSAEDGRLARLSPDRAIALSQLEEELDREAAYTVVGDGAELCFRYLKERGFRCRLAPAHLRLQSAVGVGMVAEEMALAGKTRSPQELVPVYLRLSQAERERLERLQTQEKGREGGAL